MTSLPRIICHMTSSIDGGLHPSRYTASPDGGPQDWSKAYEAIHDRIDADGWIVGRVTMAEMAKGKPHPPSEAGAVERPVHVARPGARPLAITLDQSGKLHFAEADVGGDHVVVLLGSEIGDLHLAELAAGGISYIVSPTAEVDLAGALATLRARFGVETLLLEGGGSINGSLLAAGLVDELSVIVAPALDGAADAERIVAAGSGLKGKVGLSLISCEPVAGGAVHLRYMVEPAG